MNIRHIEAIPLLVKLDRAFHGGTYAITNRATVVTRVELEGGVVGETYGGDDDQNLERICRIVNEVYAPLLAGRDVRDVERLWQMMWDAPVEYRWRGMHALNVSKYAVVTQAIAAVDNAVWDALGKALKQPVYRLIGGYAGRVRAIATGGYMNASGSEDVAAEVERITSGGITGMKLKVGKLSVEEDIERTHMARRAGGPDFLLAVDANQAWQVDEAVRFARAVRDLDLAWLEEPVVWYDQVEGNARVRQEGVPINLGQGEITRQGCRDFLLRGAADILNVDVTFAPGVTEWRRIAAMAHSFGARMGHHEEPQLAVHLLAGVPHGLAVEVFPDPARDPLWAELPVQRPAIVDGYMIAPDRPGFGIDLNHDVIEKYRVRG
ncbi:MAG: mandelate racemase/muconate lactonizing enzyme family protein [SAR202 cluster bacterium]|nr:mandelate racemase/muconate lactonizing enzyme family protein [SAR202 cluster bacterium]